MFVYLPSCNFTATCPQASKWMKDYLAQKPDLITLEPYGTYTNVWEIELL